MRPKLALLLLPMFSIFILSARSISKVAAVPYSDTTFKTAIPFVTHVQNKKLNFFQRWALKIAARKFKKFHSSADNPAKADKLARVSFWTGLAGLVLVFVPYVMLVAVPLGIIAIITGSHATRRGTTKRTLASLGVGFGIAALALFVILIIVAVIFWAVFLSAWN